MLVRLCAFATCVYLCVCVCVCLCVRESVCVYAFVRMCVNEFVFAFACVRVRIWDCLRLFVYARVHVLMCFCRVHVAVTGQLLSEVDAHSFPRYIGRKNDRHPQASQASRFSNSDVRFDFKHDLIALIKSTVIVFFD